MHAEEEHHVKMETKAGMMLSQVKECLELLEVGRGKGRSPISFRSMAK
jgi:hypothetical protein